MSASNTELPTTVSELLALLAATESGSTWAVQLSPSDRLAAANGPLASVWLSQTLDALQPEPTERLTLLSPSGAAQGDLVIQRPAASNIAAAQVAALIGRLFADLQELNSLQVALTEVKNQAVIDPLTGLLNRRGWEEFSVIEEQRAERHEYPLGLLVLDLDRLKPVNDKAGYKAGDALLKQTAAILKQQLREEDLVARWGGDEFAILLPYRVLHELPLLIERLRNELQQAGIAASFGYAVVEPNLATAWQLANRRLRTAKLLGREEEIH